MSAAPPEVRVLPMSMEEFSSCSVQELQQKFFLEYLPKQDGRYRHYKAGLRARPNSVVLFQYRGSLVASAIFRDAKRDPDEDGYKGALYFDVKSIRVFDPIGPDVVSRIWPNFKGFSQVKWSLPPTGYAAFERELKRVEAQKGYTVRWT